MSLVARAFLVFACVWLLIVLISLASGATVQPETEPETTQLAAQPEGEDVDPEGGGTEPEGEGAEEPIAESDILNAEAEVQYLAESSEPEAVAEISPSEEEVILPPFALLMTIIIGIVYLILKTRVHWWKPILQKTCCRCRGRGIQVQDVEMAPRKKDPLDYLHNRKPLHHGLMGIVQKTSAVTDIDGYPQFFSEFDVEVMKKMKTFHNTPKELFQIAFPAMLSLVFCPVVLFMFKPTVNYFWPDQIMPDVNEAISSFLMPSGLVYATVFGSVLMASLKRKTSIYLKMSAEIAMVDQMATMSLKLRLPSVKLRLRLLRAIKAEAICMMMSVQNRTAADYRQTNPENIIIELWSVPDVVRESERALNGFRSIVDRSIWDKLMIHVVSLNSICSDRMKPLHCRIHPLKWLIMEMLSFFAFFGISMLKADSYRLELTFCFMTVFSIAMQCYVISDLDSPFSGFFRINMSALTNVAEHMELIYKNVINGNFEIPPYPDKRRR